MLNEMKKHGEKLCSAKSRNNGNLSIQLTYII